MRSLDPMLDDIFSRAKQGARISKKDVDYAKAFLKRDDASMNDEAHRAIYVIFLSRAPSDDNIRLLEHFLADDVIDYNKMAALRGLAGYWGLSEKYKEYIYDILKNKIGDDDYSDTGYVALRIALSKIKEGLWEQFSDLIDEKISGYLATGAESLDEKDERAFIDIGKGILQVLAPDVTFKGRDFGVNHAFRLAGSLREILSTSTKRTKRS